MGVRLLVGDVRDRIREIPDGTVDLVCCSPPFLALRKYGDDGREMGSERTPADFLDALLELTGEFRRVLTPHGSIAIELGDTYSGSGGAGGDYGPVGLRSGQPAFDGSAARTRSNRPSQYGTDTGPLRRTITDAWPLAKSLTLIPTLYPASLAYGRNLLVQPMTATELLRWVEGMIANGYTADEALKLAGQHITEGGTPREFDRWRVRNLVVWARPNPPVGALGDKVRPATSYITVACVSARRWFDLDAVRTEHTGYTHQTTMGTDPASRNDGGDVARYTQAHPAGAPPLDWWEDDDPTGHATLILPTQPYPGAHYATWPETLAARLIKMMCPLRVCTTCGKPSERIVGAAEYVTNSGKPARMDMNQPRYADGVRQFTGTGDNTAHKVAPTLGWTTCGHDTWRPGVVCDPFAGSGTTLAVAQGHARDAIGIELYQKNADLIRDRVGMFLDVA